jgi:uncharacterized protein YbjT (DUF2867 family)
MATQMGNSQFKLLLTGASGYLGGSVLNSILKSTNATIGNVKISALVRSKEQAEYLISKNIEPLWFNDFQDTDILSKAASANDGA